MSAAAICGHCGALLDLPPFADERFLLFDHWLDIHRESLIDGTLTTSMSRVTL